MTQVVKYCLAFLSEARAYYLPKQALIRVFRVYPRPKPETHHATPNLRWRTKRAWANVKQLLGLAIRFHQHRQKTALTRARRRHDPLGHLALQHQYHLGHTCALLDQSLQDRRGNVVRKIRDESRVRRGQDLAAEVCRERVGHDQFEVWH